jgi:hypothetical protein
MRELLGSCHLSLEPARQALFKVVRSDIESSRGTNTINLEDLEIKSKAGEVCLEDPIYKEFGTSTDSSYFITVGLETYRLKYGKNRIGRFEDNDIVIDDPSISRRHCCIVVHSDERMEIFDTASRNGTRVNSQKITKHWLKPGDQVTLAKKYVLMISDFVQ